MQLAHLVAPITPRSPTPASAPADAEPRPDRAAPWSWRAVAAFAAVALLLTFSQGVRRPINHDENPFVAGPALLLRTGALPYRDYFYYHMPTLLLIDAGLFWLTGHLLLAARAFNALCGAATATLIFWASLRWLAPLRREDRREDRRGEWAALGVGLMCLFNPTFGYTTGQAWNHDFPSLACLAGLLCLMRGVGRPRAGWWAFAAGLCVGLAVTSRLTYAVVPPAFVAFLWLCPGLPRRQRFRLLALVTLGVAVAALPSAWVWAQAPANAWFGNFDYPALSTQYHAEHGVPVGQATSVGARAWYVFSRVLVQPGNVFALGLAGFLVVRVLRRGDAGDSRRGGLIAVALLAALLAASAFAASPVFHQYLYAPVAFVVLCVARGLSLSPELFDSSRFRRVFAAGVVVTVAFGAPSYRGLPLLAFYRRWEPVRAHDRGVRIAELTGGRRVLTLEPIYPLEGGLPVFESLTASRFVVRAAAYVPPELRRRLRMIDERGVLDLYGADPQLPVLTTGVYPPAEDALIEAARRRGCRAVPLWEEQSKRGILWLPPGSNDATPDGG